MLCDSFPAHRNHRTPRRQNGAFTLLFVLRALSWTGLFSALAVVLQGSQWPALLFPKAIQHKWIRETERIFGSILLMLTWLFFPTTFVLTGDVSKFLASRATERTIVISNHQNFLDWWYLWHLSWMVQRHGDVKIVLRGDLKAVPVFGMGCEFFKFTWVSLEPHGAKARSGETFRELR